MKKFNWDTGWGSKTVFSYICWGVGAARITAFAMHLLFKFC